MPFLLLRHAKAGNRRKWEGPDHLRPLSEKGWAQANGLIELLAPFPVRRVLTSPYRRCLQTVGPLAAELGLTAEVRAELGEGTGAGPTLDLMAEMAQDNVIACTHGDVMSYTLDALAAWSGLALPQEYPVGKGGTWVLEGERFPFTEARYLGPPETEGRWR